MPDLDAVIRYVLSRRCAQGGYSFYRTPEWGIEEPNARDTLAALDSLRLLDAVPPQPEHTVLWLQTLQHDNGSWATVTIAWAACKALALLEASPSRDPAPWIRNLWKTRMATLRTAGERDWRGTLVELYQLMQLTGLHAPEVVRERHHELADVLETAQTDDGVWAKPGADLESTGFALASTRLGGLEVAHAPIVDWWRRCEDPVLGFRLAPTAAITSTTTIWAGLKMGAELGFPARYRTAITMQLKLLQHPSGGFSYRHKALATLWDTWHGVKAACLLGGVHVD